MFCKQKFKSYSDCQHGWVAVKRVHLKHLGIAEAITGCSYQRGKTVYLEEDCDLTTFVVAYQKAKGFPPTFVEGKYQDRSPIRSYERYSYNASPDSIPAQNALEGNVERINAY